MLINNTIATNNMDELQKQVEMLVNRTSVQNERIKDFSFILSHNIRSSTSNLMMLSDVISRDPGNLQYLRMLQETILKLNKNVSEANELLIIQDKIEQPMVKCNISDIVSKVIKWNNVLITSKLATIYNQLSAQLNVIGVPAYLESILNQVIENALRYGTSEKSKKIFIDYRLNNEYLILRIRDFGQGIDMNEHDKPFGLGSRFHSTIGGAMGMGLFIARFQIESMGGHIKLQSDINRGTSVELNFLRKLKKSIKHHH